MKRRAYLLLFALFLNLLLWLRPSPAYACSCAGPEPPADAFNRAAAVFTGRVTGISTPLNIPYVVPFLARIFPGLLSYGSPLYGRTVSLTVTDSWKGVSTTRTAVVTGHSDADCGFNFVVGNEYLVYARDTGRNLATGICYRTTSITSPHAADDFTFLATQPTLPLTTPFPWSTALCRLSLFILIVLAGLAFRARRKRKRDATPAA